MGMRLLSLLKSDNFNHCTIKSIYYFYQTQLGRWLSIFSPDDGNILVWNTCCLERGRNPSAACLNALCPDKSLNQFHLTKPRVVLYLLNLSLRNLLHFISQCKFLKQKLSVVALCIVDIMVPSVTVNSTVVAKETKEWYWIGGRCHEL
jgi:hypothetical protein